MRCDWVGDFFFLQQQLQQHITLRHSFYKEWVRESEEKNYIIFPSYFFFVSFLPFVLDWIGVKHFFFCFCERFFSHRLSCVDGVGGWLMGGGEETMFEHFFTLSHPTTKKIIMRRWRRRRPSYDDKYTETFDIHSRKIFLLMLAFFYKWGKRTLARSLLILFLLACSPRSLCIVKINAWEIRNVHPS